MTQTKVKGFDFKTYRNKMQTIQDRGETVTNFTRAHLVGEPPPIPGSQCIQGACGLGVIKGRRTYHFHVPLVFGNLPRTSAGWEPLPRQHFLFKRLIAFGLNHSTPARIPHCARINPQKAILLEKQKVSAVTQNRVIAFTAALVLPKTDEKINKT